MFLAGFAVASLLAVVLAFFVWSEASDRNTWRNSMQTHFTCMHKTGTMCMEKGMPRE